VSARLPWRVSILRPRARPDGVLHPLHSACLWTIVAVTGSTDPEDCSGAIVEVRAASLAEVIARFRSVRR
jgi:hypothetical protein